MNPSIRQAFEYSWRDYCDVFNPSAVQSKAAWSIMGCKTGAFGLNVSVCGDCYNVQVHNNSCRNRNCPGCQAVPREVWIDQRRSEVIDSPYFHAVFTLPGELNPLIYANQTLLYALMHKCSAGTLLELSRDGKHLGATPGIIQVLHTWGQELNYHPHIHCVVSGGGLTPAGKLAESGEAFFIPVRVMAAVFKGKFMDGLQSYNEEGKLIFPPACAHLTNHYEWAGFRDGLYQKQWCPYIKETFNGNGNAIEYLGRYTHRIAISNARIKSVTPAYVTFSATDYRTGEKKDITLENVEFIRRFMMHVLPSGFQKIRYYGFLNNRGKQGNLKAIFRIQGHRRFRSKYINLTMEELLRMIWGCDIRVCRACGNSTMTHAGRTYSMRC